MEDYCSNDDVKAICPPAMREDPELEAEIETWRPIGQASINDYLSVAELRGTIPQNVKSATALMTLSLMLSNSLTKYNTQETKEEKVVTLSQLKESQAIKLIKNLAKGNYINQDLEKPPAETSPASYMSITINPLRKIVDSHIAKVAGGHFV